MDLQDLLANQDTVLYWDSPYHGLIPSTDDGGYEKGTVNVLSCSTVRDVIAMRRWEIYGRVINRAHETSDETLLDDFILISDAYTK